MNDFKKKYGRQTSQNTHLSQTVYHAICGVKDLFNGEHNFRMHLCIAIILIIIGIFLHLSAIKWLWLLLVIFFVLIAETINTIVETLTNLVVGRHYNILAKKVKDVAAGGVLIASVFATIVVIILFLPIVVSWL